MDGRKVQMRPQNLFFIELVIALLFFAMSAAVILQVFAAAHIKQRQSMLTERSVICAQSVAEAYSVSGDIAFALSETFGETLPSGELITLDSEFKPSPNGSVTLTLSEERESSAAGTLKYLNICFAADDNELLSVRCAAYITGAGGAADG